MSKESPEGQPDDTQDDATNKEEANSIEAGYNVISCLTRLNSMVDLALALLLIEGIQNNVFRDLARCLILLESRGKRGKLGQTHKIWPCYVRYGVMSKSAPT